MPESCGNCLYNIGNKYINSNPYVICAYDHKARPPKTEACEKYETDIGAYTYQQRIDLVEKRKEEKKAERRHIEDQESKERRHKEVLEDSKKIRVTMKQAAWIGVIGLILGTIIGSILTYLLKCKGG